MNWMISFWCFLPLVPFFFVVWYSQFTASKTIAKASKISTNIISDKVLQAFLKKVKLESIEVVKSSNYLQNEYVAEEDKIYLSPDTLGSVDAASVALALFAGAQADAVRKQDYSPETIQQMRSLESVLFWTTFCLLSFGIMTASIPITVIGYIVGGIVVAMRAKKRAAFKRIDETAREFLKEYSELTDEHKKLVSHVLDAETRLR